jgi:hypothetical protein
MLSVKPDEFNAAPLSTGSKKENEHENHSTHIAILLHLCKQQNVREKFTRDH